MIRKTSTDQSFTLKKKGFKKKKRMLSTFGNFLRYITNTEQRSVLSDK